MKLQCFQKETEQEIKHKYRFDGDRWQPMILL